MTMMMKDPLKALLAATLFGALLGCPSDEDPVVPPAGSDSAGADVTPGDVAIDDVQESDGETPADADPNDVADTDVPPPVPEVNFDFAPGQLFSDGPFPNDTLLLNGKVSLAPLADDPRVSGLLKPEIQPTWDAHIAARDGFGTTMPAWFFVNFEPDLASFDGKVRYLTLAGPEEGRVVDAQVVWSPAAEAIGVFPAWGDYLVPGSTYAVLVDAGVTTKDGTAIPTPTGFVELVEGEHPAWKPLRDVLATQDAAASDFAFGTVFSTEEVLPLGQAVMAAVDAFALEPPSFDVRWDAEKGEFVKGELLLGAALDDYFGVVEEPYQNNPGIWGSGNRNNAALLPGGEKYTGGTKHHGFGAVLNGSIRVPVFNFDIQEGEPVNVAFEFDNGQIVQKTTAMLPFTLILCEEHLAGSKPVPVALFNHGGGVTRHDLVPFANANCLSGVATVAQDMAFHGLRINQVYEGGLLVPASGDEHNIYTGKSVGDEGYVPDMMGDPGSSAAAVAPLFAINYDADPLLIEANLLTITGETYALVRMLKEADWTGMFGGLSFDVDHIFHNSLSFGTSFSTPLQALSEDFRGIVSSVGTGAVLSVNMTMAPANAVQATGVVFLTLGLPTAPDGLQQNALSDVMLTVHQWLHGRGDPMSWAPYVLRHRPSETLTPVLTSGNSWDETLFNPAQLSYANALGVKAYTAGEEWTLDPSVPGSSQIEAEEGPGELSDNVTFGEKTTTAAIYFLATACHAEILTALCAQRYEHPYPPITLLDTPIVAPGRACQLHAQVKAFETSLMGDGPAVIVPPSGDCATLYGAD